MTALVASSFLGTVLVLLVVGPIVAMHLWKPRPVRRVLASTWLWEIAATRASVRRSSWRWWLALGLALAIGGLLAVTLTRPEVQGFGDGTRRVIVVVDNGPTMATRTRDGQTRWRHAVARARDVILAAPGPVMVTDTMGRAVSTGFVARVDALAALGRLAVVPAGAAELPPSPSQRDDELHVITDGVAGLAMPQGAVVHSVFEPADNVAVTRLATRPTPGDPLRVEAFVQVFNASPGAKSVRLTLRGGERFTVSQDLQMAAGELIDATFDVSGFEGGVLAAAALTSGDALPDDDIAYAVVDAHRMQRVVLVTRGNPALADALAALPGIRVEVVDPARFRPAPAVDAYVFDGFAPPEAPPAGALLFRPTRVRWLPSADRSVGDATIDTWDRASPLTSGVAWNAVTVRRASTWTEVPAGVATVLRSGAAALALSGRAVRPWVAVGFLPGDSDLPLQPGLPVFLGHALAHLTGSAAVQTEPLGPVRVALADAEVHDGHGQPVDSRVVPGATLFEAARPDIYTVRAGSARVQVAAAVLDPRLADVNHSTLDVDRGGDAPVAGPPIERWSMLVLACIALLLVDWVAFTRRISR